MESCAVECGSHKSRWGGMLGCKWPWPASPKGVLYLQLDLQQQQARAYNLSSILYDDKVVRPLGRGHLVEALRKLGLGDVPAPGETLETLEKTPGGVGPGEGAQGVP